jgi:tetratricopeptide (TPR) repeat protein
MIVSRQRSRVDLASLVLFASIFTQAVGQPTPEVDVPVPPRLDAAGDLVDDILTRLIDAVRESPADPQRWRNLANAYYANAFNAESEAAYLRANELGMDDAGLWHLISCVRNERGDLEGALDASYESTARDPNHAPAYWKRAGWLLDHGQIDDARIASEQALGVEPDCEAALFTLARIHIQQREPDRAVAIIDPALLAGPNSPYAHQLLGMAFRLQGRLDDARAEMARGRGARPAWSDAWLSEVNQYSTGYVNALNRVVADLRRDDFENALVKIEDLLVQFPNDPLLLEYRAVSRWRLGQFREAIDSWLEAMRADPTSHRPHISYSTTVGENVTPGTPAYQAALEHAVIAVKLNPMNAQSREQVGFLLAIAGRVPEAIRALENARRLDPQSASILGKLGELYVRAERYEEAIGPLQTLTDIAPDSGPAFHLYAVAALNTDRLDEALKAVKRARTLMPEPKPDLDELERRIEEAKGQH